MIRRMSIRRESPIPFTKQGYDKVLAEKAKLTAERPDAVENLRKAREMGDLSENGYYKAARARLSSIDANLRRVDRLVKLGRIVESAGTGAVDIGATVTVTDGKREYKYTIVGGYESDPAKKTISHVSPLGRALMGKRPGDTAVVMAPVGAITYTVNRVGSSSDAEMAL
jgi:transcription elongation factor GreA